MNRVRFSFVVGALSLAGCDCSDREASETPPAPAAPAAPVVEPPPAPTEPVEAPRRASTLSDADRTAVATAIREGRAAARESEWATALAAFERAVALDASNDDMRCEAAYVAFRAERVDDAERLSAGLDRVMLGKKVLDARRVPMAMCLYNLGLIERARERSENARRLFARSLELRPNETVQSALAAIDAPPAPERPGPIAWTTWDDVQRVAMERFCVAEHGESECPEDVSVEARLEEPSHDATSAEFDARLVRIGETMGADVAYLAVRLRESVVLDQVAYVYNPGAFGVSGEIEVQEFAIRDVVAGGAPELVLRIRSLRMDTDMAGCEDSSEVAGSAILCAADTELSCAIVPVAQSLSSGRLPGCDGVDDDGDEDLDEGAFDDSSYIEVGSEGYVGDARIEPPRVMVAIESGEAPDALAPLVAGVDFSALVRDPSFRWPRE
jgi:hypothetical protein